MSTCAMMFSTKSLQCEKTKYHFWRNLQYILKVSNQPCYIHCGYHHNDERELKGKGNFIILYTVHNDTQMFIIIFKTTSCHPCTGKVYLVPKLKLHNSLSQVNLQYFLYILTTVSDHNHVPCDRHSHLAWEW